MGYEIQTMDVAAQPTLYVRGSTTTPHIVKTIGEFLSDVGAHLRREGVPPGGAPYTRYHGIDGDAIDLEAGIPVQKRVDGSGRVLAGELPGGKVAATLHIGPYERLPEAGAALRAWADEHGERPAGPNWETYVNDPTAVAGPEEYRTEVVMPLAPKDS